MQTHIRSLELAAAYTVRLGRTHGDSYVETSTLRTVPHWVYILEVYCMQGMAEEYDHRHHSLCAGSAAAGYLAKAQRSIHACGCRGIMKASGTRRQTCVPAACCTDR